MSDKPKLAWYWAASCGGCDISALAIDDKVLHDIIKRLYSYSTADILSSPIENITQAGLAVVHFQHILMLQRMREALKGDLEHDGRRYGLVLDIGGYHKNVITLAPSLTISYVEIDLAIALLDQLLARMSRR